MALKQALQTTILGSKFDKEANIILDMPVLALRALPHLIIAIIYIIKQHNTLVLCPVSLISIAFSSVSLSIAMAVGLRKVRYYMFYVNILIY